MCKEESGGASIALPLNQITFLDIYRAVDSIEQGKLFHFHEYPNPNCPVGGKYSSGVLDPKLNQIQSAMEKEMQSITLADIKNDLKELLHMQS